MPNRPSSAFLEPNLSGTHVLDVSDPAHPRRTADLTTPAMRSPHESLSLHVARGLLAADMGSAATAGPFVDVYDVKQDCRHPVLLSSLPIGVCGHEGSFSPDGNTYWVSCGAGFYAGANIERMGADAGFLTALDVSDPVHPGALLTVTSLASRGLNLSPDGTTLYYADVGAHKGLGILDVSEIQQRRANPRALPLAHLTWNTVSLPRPRSPVSIGGHPYLVEVDEFASNIVKSLVDHSGSDPGAFVGAGRIIYFNPPITRHDPYNDFSAPAFVPERNEIWYTAITASTRCG